MNKTSTEQQPSTDIITPEEYDHAFPHVNSRIALCGWKDERDDYTIQNSIPENPCPECLRLYRARNYERVY